MTITPPTDVSTARIPHFLPYQGSKRRLAATIVNCFPPAVDTLYEPFAGSMAVSVRSAQQSRARHYIVGDALPPLVALLRTAVNRPQCVADRYEELWRNQGSSEPEQTAYFGQVRDRFNTEQDPVDLLFLACRCVANAIRFNSQGQFSQSPDRRRRGTTPERMRENLRAVSALLKGKAEFFTGDYAACITSARPQDLVYLDPPYQGTTEGNDKRYFRQLERKRLIESLTQLDRRACPYIVSYDGRHGAKRYGAPLPDTLQAVRLEICAGRSTQGTLHGNAVETVESLYLSTSIRKAARRKSGSAATKIVHDGSLQSSARIRR